MIASPSPGSDFYYLLRRVPRSLRPAYTALQGLLDAFRETREHYKEPNIAKQKLHFFQEDIQRYEMAQPTHPLLLELKKTAPPLSSILFQALLEASLLNIDTHIFETRASLLQHHQHLGGLAFQLKASLLTSSPDPACLHSLGLTYEILHHLLNLKFFLARQHLPISLDDFQAKHIDPQPILKGHARETLSPLLDDYLALAQQRMPTCLPADLNPLKLEVLLLLKRALFTQKAGWQVFSYHVELTPLRKLFLTHFGL